MLTLEQMLADLELEVIYRLKMFLLVNGYRFERKFYQITTPKSDVLITKCGANLIEVGWIDQRIVFVDDRGLQYNPETVELTELVKFVDQITEGKSL